MTLPSSNLGSLGDSAQLNWGEGDLQRFDNGGRGSGRHGRESCARGGTGPVEGEGGDFTRSRNDSRGRIFQLPANVRQPCPDQGSV